MALSVDGRLMTNPIKASDDQLAKKDFLRIYGMARNPFVDQGDLGLFFSGAGRGEVLKQIQHLLTFTHLLLLVTGQEGSGKTHLCKVLSNEISSDNPLVISGTVGMGVTEFLNQITRHYTPKKALPVTRVDYEALLKNLLAELTRPQKLILLIDNAHKLDPQLVSLLVSWASVAESENYSVHIVLFSLPQLQKTLQPHPNLKNQDLLHEIQLDDLGREDIKKYVNHCLESTGLNNLFELNSEDLDKIYNLSGGDFSKVNFYAHEVLFGSMSTQQDSNKYGIPSKHLIAASVVALLLLVLVITQQLLSVDDPASDEKAAVVIMDDTVKPAVDIPQWDSSAKPPTEASGGNEDTPTTVMDIELPTVAVQENESSKTVASPQNSLKDSQAKSNTQSNEEQSPTKAELSTDEKVASLNNGKDKLAGTVVRNQDSSPEVKASASSNIQTKAKDQTKAKEVKTEKIPVADTKSVKKAETKKVKPSPPRKTPTKQAATKRYSGDGSWFLAQSRKYYVLQVLGTSSESAARTFVQRHKNNPQLKYFKTRHNGQPWYVVSYGRYSTHALATAAIKKLPNALQQQNPWPRSLQNIQQEIRKYN
ncbi:AAA family ATPase [Zooshikella harenae]|uniref:AAA family ATPase n=1 Tax=Zooshikella harenae TaxID=2827238 RepID=A0ABS5ZHE1_9GAMM|nr:AAA family ATPase [Zooshikella harenae]MBU2713447.1 AAA family ATPase [Zooshikella harenae]